ncbi:hypothetical protein PR048_012745 [Dryococelus australis]|uniref:Uncharacterized protein n=1 Tax=Dryococelus australis TaxID=614101 RepID=A0ABQ9HQ96_9NEOP|nr:hypothetical protein PR048_012745 [Dryococelus australis]
MLELSCVRKKTWRVEHDEVCESQVWSSGKEIPSERAGVPLPRCGLLKGWDEHCCNFHCLQWNWDQNLETTLCAICKVKEEQPNPSEPQLCELLGQAMSSVQAKGPQPEAIWAVVTPEGARLAIIDQFNHYVFAGHPAWTQTRIAIRAHFH